jgi:hypothetical protein
MATIGQILTSPESGWRRYDDTDSRFVYKTNGNGSWTASTSYTQNYNSTWKSYLNGGTNGIGTLTFKFYGTKIRMIAPWDTGGIDSVIKIDGNIVSTSPTVKPSTTVWRL